jgi:hypothetical protein
MSQVIAGVGRIDSNGCAVSYPVEVHFSISQFCQSSDLILTKHNLAKLLGEVAAQQSVTV